MNLYILFPLSRMVFKFHSPTCQAAVAQGFVGSNQVRMFHSSHRAHSHGTHKDIFILKCMLCRGAALSVLPGGLSRRASALDWLRQRDQLTA